MKQQTPNPIYKAGLTRWVMPFDRDAGARAPAVPDDPGPIHAVRPVARELSLREPSFLEETYMYRAALCGAKVKVIMPNSFKPAEAGACAACIAETRKPPPKTLMRPGGGFFSTFGDPWNPSRWRRLSRKRQGK